MDDPRPKPTKRRRRLLLVGFLVVTFFGLALAALHVPAVQRAAIDRALAEVAERYGIWIDYDAFTLTPLAGRLDLQGLRAAAGAAAGAPFLRAERFVVELDWLDLLGSPPRLEIVEIDTPIVDLTAPRPPTSETSEPADGPPIEIAALRLRGGEVRGVDVGGAAPWIEAASAAGIDLDGRLEDGRLEFALDAARVLIRRQGSATSPLELDVSARLDGPFDGPWDLDDLAVRGPGLEFAASGALGTAADDPLALRFELAAEPALFAADLAAAGRLDASGDLDLRRHAGTLRTVADGFPAAVLAPWLSEEQLAQAGDGAPPGLLDLDAELTSVPGAEQPLTGHAELVWRRAEGEGESRLLELDADLDDGRLDDAGNLLPSTLVGRVRAESRGLPIEILRPWLSPELRAKLGGSRFDLTTDLALAAGDVPLGAAASGDLSLVWRRLGKTLAEVDGRLDGARLTRDGVDSSSLRGRARVLARALPVETFEPWLGGEALERIGGRETVLDLDAEVDLVGGHLDLPDGRAELLWRRGADALAAANARTLPRATDGEEVRLALDATLLPGAFGERHLVSEIRAPSWARLGEGELRDARLDLEIADLDAALDEFASRWAPLAASLELAALRERWPLVGGLEVRGKASGRWTSPRFDLTAAWSPDGPVDADGAPVALESHGNLGEGRGEVRVKLRDVDLARFADGFGVAGLAGRVGGTLELDGGLDAATGGIALARDGRRDLAAELVLQGSGLRFGEESSADGPTRIETLQVDAAVESTPDGAVLRLGSLVAEVDGHPLEASGHLEIESLLRGEPLRRGALDVRFDRPVAGVETARLGAVLEGGVLRLDPAVLEGSSGHAELAAVLPLESVRVALANFDPELAARFAEFPLERAEGPFTLEIDAPRLDLGALYGELGVEADFASELRGLRGALTLPPDDLTGAVGELTLAAGFLETQLLDVGRHRLSTIAPLRLLFGEHRVELPDIQLRGDDGSRFDLIAAVDLAPGWTPTLGGEDGEPAATPVRDLLIVAEGRIDFAWLRPYLAGARTEGAVDLKADISGPPDALHVNLLLESPDGALVYPDPYVTRFEAPLIELAYENGELFLSRARGRLNEGTFAMTGILYGPDGSDLFAHLEGVRYRVDYGLSMVLSGDLELALPPTPEPGAAPVKLAPRGLLAGTLTVDRGLLRRDLNLERELFSRLFAAPELQSGGIDPLATIDLDVDIPTARGVRVKNNLADLSVTWSSLEVHGTLAEPLVRGVLEVEPGGYLDAYGQVVRIDQGTLTLTGDPEAPPVLDLVTTSAFEDPMILEDRRAFAGSGESAFRWRSASARPSNQRVASADVERALTEGLATYYGQRVSERLTSSLGMSRITVQPVLIFNETDPNARLNISQELSQHVSFTISVDLRNSQQQTYLLDLHDFRKLPRMRGRVFTTDASDEGVSIEQNLAFGGGRQEDQSLPRLRRMNFTAPPEISERLLKARLGLRRGDRLPEGIAFDLEVDAAEHLRRRGYPDARVRVALESLDEQRADLHVSVEPGPQVIFEFEGDKPPPALRRTITAPYRADFAEIESLADVEREAVRAFRGLGHTQPEVEAVVLSEDVVRSEGESENALRTVVVQSVAGPRLSLAQPPRFVGLPEDDAAHLAASFSSLLARVELAVAAPEADAFLLERLRGQGYPDPEIVDRRLEQDGDLLIVEMRPGPRQRIVEVELTGLDVGGEFDAAALEELRAALLKAGEVQAGDPPRSAKLASGTVRLRTELRRRGWVDAKVRAVLDAVGGEETATPLDLRLTWRVEPGARYHLDDIRWAGLRSTKPEWAAKKADLDLGEHLDPTALSAARRRLYGTGLFSSIRATTERGDDGRAAVTFDIEERPRWNVGYGLRWSSDDGAAVILDVVDHNVAGRGFTLGARAFYSADDRAARLYTARRNLFGTKVGLEAYLEGRQRTENDEFFGIPASTSTDSLEATLQAAVPVGSWIARVYARMRTEKITDDFLLAPIRLTTPLLGTQWLYDRRDDAIDPRRGLFTSTDLSFSDSSLGSDFNFARLFSQASLFRPLVKLGGREVVWAQSVRLGILETSDEFFSLEDELFFAGGEYSLRGYRARTVGPFENLAGELFFPGGEALLVVNQEVRFPIWGDTLSGVAFVDVGNVWQTLGDFGSDFVVGTGVGLRASTPIGLLRLDWAVPLDRREFDPSSKVYIGFGHAF